MTLRTEEPSFAQSQQAHADKHDTCENSRDGDNLLYETYDEYFNMEEEITFSTPMTPDADRRSTSRKPAKVQVSMSTIPLFVVLNESSPISPSCGEILYTPISPLKPWDVPNTLADLIPQPVNSLLELINMVTDLANESSEVDALWEELDYRESNRSIISPTNSVKLTRGRRNRFSRPNRLQFRSASLSPSQPSQPQSRGTDITTLNSQELPAKSPSFSPPPSSAAEVSSPDSSPPRCRYADLTQPHGPQTKPTYPPRKLPPIPLGPGICEARSVEGQYPPRYSTIFFGSRTEYC